MFFLSVRSHLANCYAPVNMNATRRFFAQKIFALRVHAAKGYAYEDLFKAIMQRGYSDFRPIQPYGNLGDRKNDGYCPGTGRFYQVYSPATPEEKLKAASEKALEDFEGLKQHWNTDCPIKSYRFVFNDKYGGSIQPLEAALAAIARKHCIDAAPFLAKDLEDEAFRLSEAALQDVLGTIIPATDIEDADYEAIREVVNHVLNAGGPVSLDNLLATPALDEKIAFNGLSPSIGHLLSVGALQTGVIDDFFSNQSAHHKQTLRDHLAAIYQKERETSSGDPDRAFFAILAVLTPKASTMQLSVQQAALVVMAYFFEACDIFEAPDASS